MTIRRRATKLNYARGGTYAIVYLGDVYLGEQRYRFGESMFPAIDCGELLPDDPTIDCTALVGSDADREAYGEAVRWQSKIVYEALEATNQYVLDGDELRLQGETAETRLVLDNPEPRLGSAPN